MNRYWPILLLALSACHPNSNDFREQQRLNAALAERITRLEEQVKRLTVSPAEILRNTEELLKANEVERAQTLLSDGKNRYYTSDQLKKSEKLFQEIDKAKERIAYEHLVNSFNEQEYTLFQKKYPRSKYLTALKRKKTSRYSYSSAIDKKKKKSPDYKVRVGALCCDGTTSNATGRGACSHHGGVCQWLYK